MNDDEFDEFDDGFVDIDWNLLPSITCAEGNSLIQPALPAVHFQQHHVNKPSNTVNAVNKPNNTTVNTVNKPANKTTLDGWLGKPVTSDTRKGPKKIVPSEAPRQVIPESTRIAKVSNHSLNLSETQKWIYPTNLTRRDYQFNIVQKALFYNTLVALPTGLGKTFIAAVVMANFYRWFPTSKLVFCAPTRPLVTQQIEACITLAGIPKAMIHELNGSNPPKTRAKLWREGRVFFLTPHIIQNDLETGICPALDIALLVIDEAHKTTGNYPYAQVLRAMVAQDAVFRVLALTATPGSDTKSVQAVLDTLLIERIEVRTEDSLDVKPFLFSRKVEQVVVPSSPFMEQLISLFEPILAGSLMRLCEKGAFYEKSPKSVSSSYVLIQARERWRVAQVSLPSYVKGSIESEFGVAISIFSAYHLLLYQGTRSFYVTLKEYLDDVNKPGVKISNAKSLFVNHPNIRKLFSLMDQEMTNPLFSSHPKMDKVIQIILQHFVEEDSQDSETNSRVIVFAKYRDTVQEIMDLLESHPGLIRPLSFVGQSAGRRATSAKGFTQKEQLAILQKFQAGESNVLVSTSIGEEGLDIGQVDLILCYDSASSPIQLLQRMGRTGRKRAGKVVVLLSKGREEENFKNATSKYKNVQKSLADSAKLVMYDGHLARVLPSTVNPTCSMEWIHVPEPEPVIVKEKKSKADAPVKEKKSKADAPLKEKKPRAPPKKKVKVPDPTDIRVIELLSSSPLPDRNIEFPVPALVLDQDLGDEIEISDDPLEFEIIQDVEMDPVEQPISLSIPFPKDPLVRESCPRVGIRPMPGLPIISFEMCLDDDLESPRFHPFESTPLPTPFKVPANIPITPGLPSHISNRSPSIQTPVFEIPQRTPFQSTLNTLSSQTPFIPKRNGKNKAILLSSSPANLNSVMNPVARPKPKPSQLSSSPIHPNLNPVRPKPKPSRFMELEANLSSDDSASSDELDESDRDLSGLIADSQVSEKSDASRLRLYRSVHDATQVRIIGRTVLSSSPQVYREDEDEGSLADFVVDDDDVL